MSAPGSDRQYGYLRHNPSLQHLIRYGRPVTSASMGGRGTWMMGHASTQASPLRFIREPVGVLNEIASRWLMLSNLRCRCWENHAAVLWSGLAQRRWSG